MNHRTVHRNSSITSCESNVWQVSEIAPMRDFWQNLLTPWRQCGWKETTKELKAPEPPQHDHDSPTTSLDEEDDESIPHSEDRRQSIFDHRPPLAKQRASSIQYVVPAPPVFRQSLADSCNSSTRSRHKREKALQEYPDYIDRIIIALDDHQHSLEDDELTTEDGDFFDLSSSSSSSSDEDDELIPSKEAWKYEWVDQAATNHDSLVDMSPKQASPGVKDYSACYLPQTPVPPCASPHPIFVVGWAAIEILQDERQDDDEDHTQVYFCQLIRDESLLALQLCDEDCVRYVIPYVGNLRSEYRRNHYALNVGNSLKIVPVPVHCSQRLTRDISAGVQHDNILFLQFGLDAAARSVVR